MRTLRRGSLALVLPVIAVALWWVATENAESFYFPPLSQILGVFVDLWVFDLVPVHVVPSIVAILVGLGVSIVLGIAIGVALGLSKFASEMVSPVLQFLRYLPAVALLPLAIQLIGIGLEMRVAIIVLGAIWPILLNTMDGVRAINPSVVDVAKSTRLRWTTWIFRLVLPAASPQIFTGIRASLAVAVVLMVASELLGSSRGMGYFILESQRQFSLPEMWSGMILLGIIGYLLNVIFARIEHAVLAWHRLSRS
ncbi:ABC transporter permease [Microbacterium luteum]|uniref:ABC transporter permease n=1 Tax=Microbacterium TaxID=33882 RepID=UPI001889B7E2|nr:ABC transporter permease [Microbacterium luteum]